MAEAAPKQAHVLGGTAIKPKEYKGWEAVRNFLYNRDTGQVCSRTPKSWALITGFYIIYYSCLAAFWAAMLTVFFQTLPEGMPKWQNENGLIGISPGLGLRPKQTEARVDSSMIVFSENAADDGDDRPGWKGWADRSTEFLKKYRDSPYKGFDVASLGDCGKIETGHGYKVGKPCVFLKLNKIYGLQHSFYNDTSDDQLKDLNGEVADMPQSLKDHIDKQTDQNQVWVNCVPKNIADKEGLNSIKYFPESRGFPGTYFPFKGEEDFKSPLVAVQFEPKLKGQLIHIECRAWAKNIGYNRRDKIGINSFEILKI